MLLSNPIIQTLSEPLKRLLSVLKPFYFFTVLIALLILTGPGPTALGQTSKLSKNKAFKEGEVLEFELFYDAWLTGRIVAATATAEVKKSDKKFFGNETYHIDTEGKSRGVFNFFYKVHDQFDSYVDKETLVPYLFIRRTREGGWEKDDEYYFDHNKKSVKTRKLQKPVPHNVQDIISAFYYCRNQDFSGLKKGDYVPIHFFLDDTTYNSVIIYEGKEVIETSIGKFKCLKFKPMVATGKVFTNPYPMSLWVTDDRNHLPILATSGIVVGTVKMELVKFKNLANPMTSKIE